jgi:hypothetical protein
MTTLAQLHVIKAGGAQAFRLVVSQPERSRTMWSSLRKSIHDMDKEHMLELVGLEQRRTTAERLVPAFTLFGVGVLAGLGVGLMVAPRPGRELRYDLRGKLEKKLPARVMQAAEPLEGVRAHS